jgi:hypothetical protein
MSNPTRTVMTKLILTGPAGEVRLAVRRRELAPA